MSSPYRVSGNHRRSAERVPSDLPRIVWGGALTVGWIYDLSCLISASLKGTPIFLELTTAALLVMLSVATLRGDDGR